MLTEQGCIDNRRKHYPPLRDRMLVPPVLETDDGEPRGAVGRHDAGLHRRHHDSDSGRVHDVRAVAAGEEQAGLFADLRRGKEDLRRMSAL